MPEQFRAILTRFNMAIPGFRLVGGLRDDSAMRKYVDERVSIFASVCLPSVLAQTVLPDAWLIGCDPTRREEIEPLLALIGPHSWIRPVWQRPEEHNRATFVRSVTGLLTDHHRIVVTTRLDNDDALALAFCEEVAGFVSQTGDDDCWIIFPTGVQFNGRECLLFRRANNAFVSRCEPAEKYRSGEGETVLHGNHTKVFSFGRVYQPREDRRMWLQYVHGANLVNAEKKLRKLPDTAAELSRFGLTKLAATLEAQAKNESLDAS